MASTAISAPSPSGEKQSFLAGGMMIVIVITVAELVLHCVFNNRYGYFRDEFDYMACGNHLAWGYVDHPPLIPFVAKISRLVLGDSLRSIRFVPALASSALVMVSAMIARELGGRRFAIVLCAIAVAIGPFYLSDGSLLTTNSLEPILWMGCAYFAILAIQRENPRYWLWFGVVAGIGMEEKYSIAMFGLGIVIGLLLTEQRRVFAGKWIWLGGVVAFLIFLPNFIWNVQHHWPFLELVRNIKASGRDVELSPLQYVFQQILLIHPFTAPIWITGLVAFLFSPRLKPYRMFGFCYLVMLTLFIVMKGKNYYLAPIYPVLLAAGAIKIESGIQHAQRGWLKPVIVVLLLAAGTWSIPWVVPVLPIERFIVYMNKTPLKAPRTEHSHMRAALPQNYADQFGWEEIVATTAQAWSWLAPAERHDCGIFAQNFGQAGAIDFFGPRYGLPPALSGHQTYYLWGPRGYSGNCLIVLDDSKESLQQKFERVEYVGSSDNPNALERHIPVYICRGAKFGSLAQLWPQLKKWL
ncbi:MAG TPA: glycosyltransferase family 39 protein [Terriglobales bacterium]|nr:glycosyltransferase family 39 protein [Terriglobales bacterium]